MAAKKILVISWALPPYLSPRSIQVARTLNQLAKSGWQSDVLTLKRPSRGHRQDLDFDLARRYKKGYNVKAVVGDGPFTIRAVASAVFPCFRPMPDPHGKWVKEAVHQAERLLANNRYSLIMSFGQPWSSHLVGLDIKRKSGLPWIAHFSDPWVDNPYNKNLTAKQVDKLTEMEEAVIGKADRVIFTNTQTLRKVMTKYPPSWKVKAFVLPHGFDGVVKTSPRKRRTKNFELLHNGNLYGKRSPESVIRALGKIRDRIQGSSVKIKFVGQVKHQESYSKLAKDHGVEKSIVFLGRVGYSESDRLSAQADALLLIDAPSQTESLFLPSKLVDYLKFSKPILGITPKKGASADLLAQFSYPTVDPLDIEGIAKQLLEFQRRYRIGTLRPSSVHRKKAEHYSIRKTTSKLLSIIQPLVG